MNAKPIDKIRVRFNIKKSIFIVSDEGEEITAEIRNIVNKL